MIERHLEGIAAYCRPENKVALGFVEGLNNKIRVLQRRAYGLRDGQSAGSMQGRILGRRYSSSYPNVLEITHTTSRRPF